MADYELCRLHSIERRNCSIYGNPCSAVTFTDSKGNYHRAKTASNSSAGYTIDNYRYAENNAPIFLEYHFTRSGNCIIDFIKHSTPEKAREEAEAMEVTK